MDLREFHQRSVEARRRQRAAHAAEVWPKIQSWRQEGMGWRRIAAMLNRQGITAPRGGAWHPNQVRRIHCLMMPKREEESEETK